MEPALPYPGMLLDLDDTVLAFDAVAEGAWAEVCARHAAAVGCGVGDLRAAARRYWSDAERHRVGRLDLTAARRRIVGTALAELGADRAGTGREVDGIVADSALARQRAIHPLPGAVEALEGWRREGRRLALVTNGAAADQRRKIERFELERRFDAILIEGECGFGKPDCRIFRLACERLGLSPGLVCMVGDSLEFDIAGARDAGIHAVWVDAAGRGVPPGIAAAPDRTVPSLAALAAQGGP